MGWGTATIFLMPVGYIAAWVFSLLSGATLGGNCTPIGASALIAGNGYIRVTEGAGATHTSYVNDISPFPP